MAFDDGNEITRSLNRLTALKVARAKAPGMYADGGSLYLRVADGGSKQWIFRYVANGRLRDMGIGPVHTLSLAEARERATEARKLRLDGIDPIAHKRARRAALAAADAKAMTFRQCAEGFIRDNEAKWTNAKHRREWEGTLSQYVYPALGSLPVAAIDTPLVLKVIKPLWERVPETASRVRGRIENVLGWATVHHYRTGDNPARWQEHLEHALPARSDIPDAKVEHHAALPYEQVAAFMAKLRQNSSVGARCTEFITLTAARVSEAAAATWPEIDFVARVWTVPADRIKGRLEHRVPLSAAAIAVLKQQAAIRQSDYVFPGARNGRPVSENTPNRLAKLAAGADITAHGLRSTFRDWAAERTNFPRELAEKALAHTVGRRDGESLSAWRSLGKTPQAHGGVGRVLRQGRDGRGQGGRTRPGANTAIAPEGAGPGGPPPDISPPSGLPRAIITSSWAVKAVIMARKRPLPEYNGALAEPIYADTVSGEPDEWIKAQVIEKMALLCTHYRIEPSENCWWQLAVSLACKHVLDYNFRSGRNVVVTRHGRLG